MTINHVLAVVAVSDFDTSHRWYEQLIGDPATNVPMPGSLAEWRLTDTGWLQVFHDPERAGTSMANVAAADIDDHIEAIRERGIEPGEIFPQTRTCGCAPSTTPTATGSRSSGTSARTTDHEPPHVGADPDPSCEHHPTVRRGPSPTA